MSMIVLCYREALRRSRCVEKWRDREEIRCENSCVERRNLVDMHSRGIQTAVKSYAFDWEE